ncbi:MAG: aldo/keto reductase, partial [Chloroflexi bacterium]|nr:aldo/keto reductase [Chloroflexota bacterium]
ERGVNYIDTSPDYSAAGSEEAVGKGIRGFPRDRLFLATKFCSPTGHLPPGTPVEKYVAAVEASLRRLGTDYVDLCHIHSCDEVERLLDENVHEAFDRLRQAGKLRFLGFSTHTPRLLEVAGRGIESGRFDVMMLAYHFGMWPTFGHVLEKAKQHDVGIVAMKTLKGGRHADLAASGTSLRPEDVAVLERYDELVRGDYCQPHCGLCLDSCPEDLAINDVLRYRMYARDYGWEREGMRLYATLDRNASLCAGCPAPCAGTCPHGVPIRTAMMDAHRRLVL